MGGQGKRGALEDEGENVRDYVCGAGAEGHQASARDPESKRAGDMTDLCRRDTREIDSACTRSLAGGEEQSRGGGSGDVDMARTPWAGRNYREGFVRVSTTAHAKLEAESSRAGQGQHQ